MKNFIKPIFIGITNDCSLIVLILFLFTSCFHDAKTETASEKREELFSYKTIELPVTLTKKSTKKEAGIITAKASIESMHLVVELDLSKINRQLFPASTDKKDTLSTTVFNVEFTCNDSPLPIKFSKKKHRWLYRNGFETQSDSVLSFSSGEKNLNYDKEISVSVPMYVFEKFAANKEIKLEVRIWQDYFLSERKEKTILINNMKQSSFYKDTLKTKILDNTYSFTLTVPEIYKTEIVCDSIILQNDSAWSPYGSDHTLFKSSLPDIYFSLEDYAGNLQSSSHVEKSTPKFLIGDTLPLYHYQENEPFYLSVYDFDVLSKNDLLGKWKGKLIEMKNDKRYKLKFDHVSELYMKKRSFGKIN